MQRLIGGLGLIISMMSFSTSAAPLGLKPLQEVLIYPQFELPAQVISQNESQLSAEINAKVERILVRPGDSVNYGQLLVELDCRDYRLQLEAAQASLKENQAQLAYAAAQRKRFAQLQMQSLASASQLEEATADYERRLAMLTGLTAQQKQAQLQVERCQVKSPYRGVVQAQLMGVGSLASLGSPLLSLVQTEAAEIRVSVPLSLAGNLQRLPAVFKASGIDEVSVKLLRMSNSIDAQTRNVLAWYQSGIPLRIGLAGNLLIKDATPHLPAHLLVKRGDHYGFFIRSNEQAKFIPLPMAQEGRANPLPPALHNAKMAVITEGFQRLSDGEALP
jgi:multidrug efflux pump subunit AcrA (membrane-fusion protein)